MRRPPLPPWVLLGALLASALAGCATRRPFYGPPDVASVSGSVVASSSGPPSPGPPSSVPRAAATLTPPGLPAVSDADVGRCAWVSCGPTPAARVRSALLAPTLTGVVFAYGYAAWDYFTVPFHVKDEKGFGRASAYGGADKTGHAFTSHALASALAAIHRTWRFDRREAATRAALTSLFVMTMLEVGDATSAEYGFSWQDVLADAAGCLFAWFQETSPWFDRAFDLRWEFVPSGAAFADRVEPFTAYEQSAILLTANVGALLGRRHPRVLDFLDLQLGYRVRDLDRGPDERRQELLLGVGLNVANLVRLTALRKIARVFEFYQVPFVSLRFAVDLT